MQKQGIYHMRSTQKQGQRLQQLYLDKKVGIEEIKGNGDRVQILCNIANVEDLWRIYNHINYVLQDQHKRNLTKVSYPTGSGCRTMKTPKEMETKILEQKIKHFSQATSTPAATEGSIFQIPNDTPLHQYQNFPSWTPPRG